MEQTTAEGLKIVLLKGNIQDQTTHVIVNTIAGDMNLNQGAVSNAILQAAGPGLQIAVKFEAGVAVLGYGNVVTTDGFNLKCWKVFHVVCPTWDNGAGQAEETLASITRFCLEKAENLRMGSLSFPAIGTGVLNFPRDVVSRVLLREIKTFSSRLSPQHLREVVIVVHPSDSQTVDCFTKAFSDQIGQSNFKDGVFKIIQSPSGQFIIQSQQSSASFTQVYSPSVGVYQMQMGSLTLEVSSGDITKETCDTIVNASNKTFNLYAGVSKAILDSAGWQVQMECEQIVRHPNYQPSSMILTSAGQLLSRNIIHVVGQNDPKHIKETVFAVLEVCEGRGFRSVAFPALGTGQGGADPLLVADAMVEAVVDFVKKKQPKLVHSVKILIFQTFMVTEFHKSMKRKKEEEVAENNIFKKFKGDSSSSLPQHWDDMKDDLLKLIPLNPGDKEYSDVEILLKQTGLRTTIITIERVQNPTLWQSYQLKKEQLEKKNKHKNNEKRLFHGTKADSTDLINHHGFNRSHAGKHAAMFGNGTYFAVDPCYSASGYATPDSRGHKRMYLARVLVGDFTQGAAGMITPPAKNSGNASDLYDSVTNNIANPTMFIVFNDMHAYPEYLITFT